MSLLINKAINALLSANTDITAKVGTRLFPILASNDSPMPFIVYKRTNYKPAYTKDGCAWNSVTVQLDVISESYAESVTLIQAVRDTLEGFKDFSAGVYIGQCRVSSANESMDGETYIQELVFDIQTT